MSKSKVIAGKIILILTFIFCNSFTIFQSYSGSQANKLKVALIVNFLKYTAWESLPADEIRIGVWGDSPIIPILKNSAAAGKVQNKNLVIKKIDSVDELINCNAVFIPENTPDQTSKNILEKLHGKNILIIGEKKGLAVMGASLDFIEVEGKIKFEANRNAISNSRLSISSELLRHAVIIN